MPVTVRRTAGIIALSLISTSLLHKTIWLGKNIYHLNRIKGRQTADDKTVSPSKPSKTVKRRLYSPWKRVKSTEKQQQELRPDNEDSQPPNKK